MFQFAIEATDNNSECELTELEEIRSILINRWKSVNNFGFFNDGWVNDGCSLKNFASFSTQYWREHEKPKLLKIFWQEMVLIAEEKLCLEGLL
jgi:hypothetical protein